MEQAKIQIITIKEQIYDVMKRRILTQKYPFDTRLRISDITSEFHVSNTPVREALNKLVECGLLVECPNAGFKVVSFSDEDSIKLEQAIKVVLVGAYLECVHENRLAQLIRLMEERLVEQERCCNASDLYDAVASTVAFDSSFVDAIENERLSRVYTSLIDLIYMGIIKTHQEGISNEQRLQAHRDLYAVVKRGNTQETIDALHRHWTYHKIL